MNCSRTDARYINPHFCMQCAQSQAQVIEHERSASPLCVLSPYRSFLLAA